METHNFVALVLFMTDQFFMEGYGKKCKTDCHKSL